MTTNSDSYGLQRRTLLKGGVAGLALFGIGSLAACTTGPGAVGAAAPAGNPVRGGRLRIGLIGGGSSEVISQYAGPTMADHARALQVYDTLVSHSSDLQAVEPKLAEEITMSDDFLVMTVKIRGGVTFHDGQELTAEDVAANFREWTKETNRNYTDFGNAYDASSVVAKDKLTVEVKFNRPWARPQGALASANCGIVAKKGGKFNGTGPFKVESFSPGKASLLVKNPDYWVEGRPYLDELEILSFADNDSLINAVKSGEVDGMTQVPFAQIPGFEADPMFTVIDAPSPNNSCFLMRTDESPFSDVRVRQAMKLLADRQQLVDVALLGHGSVGNDLFGPGLRFIDESVPVPEQDVDQAASLLRAAGVGKLDLTLQTSEVSAGMVESAVLFSEQLRNTGLMNVKVKKEDPSAYYDPTQLWMNMNFAQTDCAPVTSLSQVYRGRTVLFNETHWSGPERERFDQLVTEADGAHEALAREIWVDAQQLWKENSGYIVWNSLRLIDVVGAKVQGIVPHSAEPMGSYRFLDVWLTN